MVAFCAPAAIVMKVGFWLIAIIIAGRAQVIGVISELGSGRFRAMVSRGSAAIYHAIIVITIVAV